MQGQVFGKLTPLRVVGRNKNGTALWLCQCLCGKQTTVPRTRLTGGETRSCGCLVGQHLRTHGESKSVEYRIWASMRARCSNPNLISYRFYGARGIQVCARWQKFENFLADMGRRPSRELTLERINGNGHYEPQNVRWATRLEQAQNVRHNVNLTYQGKTQSVSMWSRETGISWITLAKRYRLGLRGDDIFREQNTQKERTRHLSRFLKHKGETKTLDEWAVQAGVRRDTLRYRLKKGWTMARALSTSTRVAPTYTHKGRTGTVAQWAEWTGLSAAGIRDRLKKGWSMEDVTRAIIYNRYSTPSRRKKSV